ncbi:hypothetical protein CANCADRAFT_30135 [Tortispora caseinolytica NRRL Y-17796]|uniref:DNA topoisomerase 2 n=1 Tax=Tortispora caseinolytica NRRL Y-17796 TaxID=767744 RepID=A0A1E4TJ76_9ASCO|nr:hypothetical protein CANCADRAFT_30135 [Tortispora caseinolytica NRRL Y-17796]
MNGATNGNKKTATETYQRLSQLEHILKRPDTYVGSVEPTEMEMWICDKDEHMVNKKIVITPGLYKIFDEILVNAADNKIRDPSMTFIKVTIDQAANTISITNNGNGIPVEIHQKEKMYIPELIFGNLLTSSNYDDNQEKVTGGRNGYGAKLCNIFSTEFTLETVDSAHGLKYHQVWANNMGTVNKPTITKIGKSVKDYTQITFKPDLKLFSMQELDEDIISVMRRRVYDLAGTVRGVQVFLNGNRIKVSNFKSYTELYVKSLMETANEYGTGESSSVLPTDTESGEESKHLMLPSEPKPTIVYQDFTDPKFPNRRWEIAFAVSKTGFNQVSFVNSIATTSGGTHVNYIVDQLVTKIGDYIKKKNKHGMLRPVQIKNSMFVFVNCLITNPSFTSQTKEQLTTKPSAFGSKCVLTDDYIKKVLRTDIVTDLVEMSNLTAEKQLKKTDGTKKSRITGIVKLDDANRAGTKDGHLCTLILTEGDSAMGLAVAGLAVVGRDYYGVFPLRGKLLNVRDATPAQIMKNAEIQALKQIIGLQHKTHYKDTKGLRYGHLMIMTDQDHDGSHIKGLIMNLLDAAFPGLLDIPGFLLEFITPIVKVTVTKGRKETVIPFYNMPEFEHWRDTEGQTLKWKHKYYKGLGTSQASEMREYFSDLDRHRREFETLRGNDRDLIDLAFNKRKADMRKEWLRTYTPGTHLDSTKATVPISDFINKELILFSIADNMRSIPSVMDGFKPGQRKVLYGCFKRNVYHDTKVSQLVGYISGDTAYHHGDQSLMQTVVGMAQDFVGSNNINLLQPIGGFGTRAMGGKDASAARYISTALSKITRKIFNPADDPLLDYLQDDESTVEPEWYVPILPMVLVNGADGIGTGWSTQIPNFNPLDISANIRRLLNGEEMVKMHPWFKGWTGHIEQVDETQYRVYGTLEKIGPNKLAITELPVRQWTIQMKEYLLNALGGTEKMKPWLKDMTEQHGTGIRFEVELSPDEMRKAEAEGLYKRFHLISTVNTSNMVAFDTHGRIRKYATAEEMLQEFYFVRLEFYQKRKDDLANRLTLLLERLKAQARFIKMIIEGELSVSNRKRKEIVKDLVRLKFPPMKDSASKGSAQEDDAIEEEEDDDGEAEANPAHYDYLLGMKIWSLTRERYEKLLREVAAKEDELALLLKMTPKDMWNKDLDDFEEAYHEFLEADRISRELNMPTVATSAKKGKKRKGQDDEYDPSGKKKNKKAKKNEDPSVPVKGVVVPIPAYVPPIKKVKKDPSATPVSELGDADMVDDGVADEASTATATAPATQASSPAPTSAAAIFGQGKSLFDAAISGDSLSRATSENIKPAVKQESAKAANPSAPKKTSKNKIESDDESEDEYSVEVSADAPARKSSRSKSTKSYQVSDSSEESDMAEDDESDEYQSD